ncbi:hypothetical protein [Sulfitobacter aestuariivivens]|uniref:Uncharacterized protein n=1 Tax=Sulfitobacter aestuariivivens TaxID=2766981 RepID=A0A927D4Z4_9RHOB|nr:hypothetical protein [Sulfitobacter aestuariivivens]
MALSALLAAGVLSSAQLLTRTRALPIRLVVACVGYCLFVWLSPQIYYGYYHLLFDDLPRQWVISWPPVKDIVGHATFGIVDSLSALGQGLLFWTLVALAVRGSGRRGPMV